MRRAAQRPNPLPWARSRLIRLGPLEPHSPPSPQPGSRPCMAQLAPVNTPLQRSMIDLDEFIDAVVALDLYISDDVCRAVFAEYDIDGSGEVGCRAFCAALASCTSCPVAHAPRAWPLPCDRSSTQSTSAIRCATPSPARCPR